MVYSMLLAVTGSYSQPEGKELCHTEGVCVPCVPFPPGSEPLGRTLVKDRESLLPCPAPQSTDVPHLLSFPKVIPEAPGDVLQPICALSCQRQLKVLHRSASSAPALLLALPGDCPPVPAPS